MRSSIPARLLQAPGEDRRSRIGGAAFRRKWRDGGGWDVVHRMAAERDDFLVRWARLKAELEGMYACELVGTVRWTAHRHFGAKIFLENRTEHRASFAIDINTGTQFAIDDLVCSAFAQRSFLKNYETDVDLVTSPLIFQPPQAGRFRDYPAIQDCCDDPSAMMTAISRDPGRLRGAAALSELCLDWIYLHEQSHYLLGHLDLLGIEKKELAIVETLEAGSPKTRRSSVAGRLRRVMEHQADAYALELLFLIYLAPTRVVRSDFETGYVALDLDIRAALEPEPDFVAFRRVARVLIVAAAIVALLMERCNEIDGPGDVHPLPSGRIFSIILNGVNLIQEFAEHLLTLRHRQPTPRDEMARIVVALIYDCVMDILLAAMVIGIQDRSLCYDARAKKPTNTDFINDIFRVFGSETMTRGIARTLVTPGAREFARLQPYSDGVYARLRPLQHGGALLEGR